MVNSNHSNYRAEDCLPALREQGAPNRRRKKRRPKRYGAGFLAVVLACLAAVSCLGRVLTAFGPAPAQQQQESRPDTPVIEEDMLSTDSTAGDAGTELTAEDKLSYIAQHPEDYPEELRNLVVKNPETLDYVYQYPWLHDQEREIDLSEEASGDAVPLLLQWDERWGYLPYGSALIGYAGCGPTCLSMVALYLTGDASCTPAAIAAYAEGNSYYAAGSGTSWTLMSVGCEAFGLSAAELPLVESRMISALDRGKPIICSMGPGDFTDDGHFIVITGYNAEGFTVNDPNSPRRSAMTWSFETLRGQIKNLWSYSFS